MGNGVLFHEALEVPVLFLEKLTQWKADNPNFKWTFHIRKKRMKRIYIKKRLFIETWKFGIDQHNPQCGKGLTIMIILTTGL